MSQRCTAAVMLLWVSCDTFLCPSSPEEDLVTSCKWLNSQWPFLYHYSSHLACPKSLQDSTTSFCLLVSPYLSAWSRPPFQSHLTPLPILFPTCPSELHMTSVLLHICLFLAISWTRNPVLSPCDIWLLVLWGSTAMSPSQRRFLRSLHCTQHSFFRLRPVCSGLLQQT